MIIKHIEKLTLAYRQTKNEYVLSVLNELTATRDKALSEVAAWHKQDIAEAFIYFDELPYSVRLHQLDEEKDEEKLG